MGSDVSSLSLAATFFYLLVSVTSLAAGLKARRFRQQRWHVRTWSLLGILFIALSVMRIFDIEELLRDELREALRSQGSYSGRRGFQRPVAASLLTICAAAGFWWAYRKLRAVRGRRNVAVMLGFASGAAMIPLIMVRLVSLSPIDALLYGPLKLNWIVDLGLSLLVGGCAFAYVRIVGSKR